MNDILENTELHMIKTIENMEKRFNTVKAGRASASLVSDINVSYYGVDTPLLSLANISIPEARQLNIKPFDKSCLGDIEKAIFEANIGITPTNNGEIIILSIPPLTEDRRKEFVKQIKGMGEDAKIALRNIRQDANKDIKSSEMNEDEQKNCENNIQNLINEFNKKVDELLKKKETELMTV